MRWLQIVLLVVTLSVTVGVVLTSQVGEKPGTAALSLLARVQCGDLDGAVREFGDNTCHCGPVGGYASYLTYPPGENPSFAFMLGQPFSIGKLREIKLPDGKDPYAVPWEKPENAGVFVPVSFDNPAQRPYFLPLDTAYGYPIDHAQLEKFLANPETAWAKGFCLRLRPSLQTGLIKPYVASKQHPNAIDQLEQSKALPPEVMRYLHPKDPGPITIGPGKSESVSQYASRLPRLKSMLLAMKVVRRGAFKRWAVKKVGIEEVTLDNGGQELKLTTKELKSALDQPGDKAK